MLFKKIPGITYQVDGFESEVTNIGMAYLLQKMSINKAYTFDPYRLTAGETPESVSEKFYQNEKYAWVILLVNGIFDPFNDWYHSFDLIEEICRQKYYEEGDEGPNENAPLYRIHHYKEIKTEKYYDSIKNKVITNEIIRRVDPFTEEIFRKYDPGVLPKHVRPITNYEYEIEQNETKRVIAILKFSHLSKFEMEFEKILENGQDYYLKLQSKLLSRRG